MPRPAPPDRWGLSAEQRDRVLIRAGEETMTLGYFADSMGEDLARWQALHGRKSMLERADEAVQTLATAMVLVEPAIAAGYDRHPEPALIRKQELVNALYAELLKAEGPALLEVTNEDVARYHAEHRDVFTKPAAVRVSHILFDDRAEAQRWLQRLLAADEPNAVLEQLGMTRIKNLGWFPNDAALPVEPPPGVAMPQITGAMRAAARALTRNGEFHPQLVESPAGFHVFRRTGGRREQTTPSDELKSTIRRSIVGQRKAAVIDRLAEKLEAQAGTQYHTERLQDLRIENAPTPRPAP